MASKEERQKRGKYRILKLGEKLDVLSDIKKGLSYTTIMQKYKISKTTVYDIKRSELKLTKFVDSTEKDVKKFSQVKNPLYENVDKAVNIWYESQRLSGVPIRGIELQTAASHFASKLNNPTFKASGGWLSRYRARHNLKNKRVVGEAFSDDEDAANRFKDDFHKLMTDEKYELFQIYNADETGVYWNSQFQENKLRVAPDQVKALLLVDNSPAHPIELISNDGNIKCKFLPPNATSVLQPMDQGVIVAFKRLYKRRQLESCLLFSSVADQPNNSVGEQTFSNLKKYDIKKAIFNFGNSWDEIKSSTIRNGWKILLEHKNISDLETAGDALQLSEDESDEDEQEIRWLEQLFQRARIEVNQESINEWIDIDLDDPGHNVLSNDDIVEAVFEQFGAGCSQMRSVESLDVALKYLEKRTEPEMLASYNTINSLRTMLMREEEALLARWQLFLSSFEMNINHRSGKDLQDADALSRLAIDSPTDPNESILWTNHQSIDLKLGDNNKWAIIDKLFRTTYENLKKVRTIITDQGKSFVHGKFPEWAKSKNIRLIKTTPYHPAGNGLAERTIREINTLISKEDGKNKFDVPTLNTPLVEITTTSDKIITLRPYRVPYCDLKEIQNQVAEMLKHNIIEWSYSPFASPVTLVTKRDITKRFCLDYRKLNDIIQPDIHPFPLIDSVLDKLSRAKIFSSADIASAYWQVEIAPESRPLLTFVTPDGQYQWTRLPFGLKNSPQIYERAISQIIQKHNLQYIEHYFDDFIIFSESPEEHIQHLTIFFEVCQAENVRLNYKKCAFFKTPIEFIGYTISAGTYTPQLRNLDTINAIKPPYNQKSLQSFLDAVNVYNKFIPNYARLRTPLNNLLEKGVKWHWSDACQQAFETLKQSLTTQPVLHLFQEGLPCQLYCDASTQGIAGILKQVYPNNQIHPVKYYSRALRPHEQNYTISELECLAIIESVEKFRIYLTGTKFTIFSDHHALQWLKSIKNPTGRLFRWSLRLYAYDYEIRYIKGIQQYEADLLSRNPFCGFLDADTIKIHQNNTPTHPHITQDTNGLHTITRKGVTKILNPEKLRSTLLNKLTKHPKGPTYGELGQTPSATKPFDLLSIDTVSGFAKYGNSKTHLHVIVDHMTRYAWTFPSKSTSTLIYIQAIEKGISIRLSKTLTLGSSTFVHLREVPKIPNSPWHTTLEHN
ncbi:hypothetical protein LAZ67_3002583 [Cordylochernes scorpioides]|uniref:Reverse transcriptase n=1 Tax=Cordylochernes scorpioides TaxID=51811 RepID=A0ABY6K9P3_9ARAC|nr:hypothetical protein LAZ67_3002583 [Cordylochernes scorpioides]